MIELIMFIVIVSVAIAGVLQVLNLTTKSSADPQLRKQALSIAEGLMEEVQLAHFTFCDAADANVETATSPAGCASLAENSGPEAGNSRPYDNVNDDVATFGTSLTYTTDVAGGGFPGGYTATVTIAAAPGLGPAGEQIAPADATPANMNALLITVIVSYNNNQDSVRLDGYRTRYAPNAPP
jgi:MSHA pilin protein MshD